MAEQFGKYYFFFQFYVLKDDMSIKLIAEIGINHNGDLELAKKLIDISVQSGIDIVKFQKRSIEDVYSKEILDTPRESPWGTTTRQQKEGLEFNESQYDEIDQYCKNSKIDWFASAWDLESLEFLKKYKSNYNKIASAMIVNDDFLRSVAKENKHTFISTGMSNLDQISNAVSIFKEEECSFELMHCVSTYPMKPEHANLQLIKKLSDHFQCNVGYSGHESGISISIAAAAIGASSIERHITVDRSLYGSDQAASLEQKGLISLVSSIRKNELAFGKEEIGFILDEEKPIAEKLRAHLI